MKTGFLHLFFRYIPRYIGRLLINITLLSLAAFFNVFSLSAIVPLLQILFGIEEANFVPMIVLEKIEIRRLIIIVSFVENHLKS